MRRLLAATALALIVLAAALGACGSGGEDEREPRAAYELPPPGVSVKKAAGKPNVIFIYSDDQNFADFQRRYMPRTFDLLVDRGTTFSDFVVATPLCCPSRATYQTGGYPHNSGVFSNRGGYRQMERKVNTLPVWMRNAGYRTAWVGKYLQAYDRFVGDPFETEPPGYDFWHATFLARYYGYEIADGEGSDKRGSRPRDYYTSVVTDYATETIREQMKRPRPLFMTVNHLAPHTGGGAGGRCTDRIVPGPRDEGAFAGAKVPRTASFNEADVSDKPSFVPRKPLGKQKIETLDLNHGCRLASLRGLDRSIADIHAAVKREGELSNTVFVFTSDNGIITGQHRLGGKNLPYEEGIHMPMVVLAGEKALGGKAVRGVSELTANVDLAPTILDLAKAKPCVEPGDCRQLDGSSLVPLLRGRGAPQFNPDRQVLIEGGKARSDCLFAGIRTPRLVYIEHAKETATGCDRDAESELYDLTGNLTGNPDPGQLENLTSPTVPGAGAAEVQEKIARLSRDVERLRSCSGRSCR